MYASTASGWDNYNMQVLDSVKLAFEEFFGETYVNKFNASIIHDSETPKIFKETAVIFLTSKNSMLIKQSF